MGSYAGIPSLAQAIQQAEGYGIPNAIPTTANNPGDITGDFGYGTVGANIAVFPDLASGEAALYNQLGKIANGTSKVYSPDMTLQQFADTYSGGDTNYANNLSSSLGVPTSTSLGSILGSAAPGGSNSAPLWQQVLFPGTYGNVSLSSSLTNTLFSSRLIILLIGIILIAAGLFSFKTTQTIIEKAGVLSA